MSNALNKSNLSLDNPHDLDLEPSKLPTWLQWVMVSVFLTIVALSGVWALTEHWRRATFALGVGMVWLGAVRATCDSRIVGVVAVRSKRFDVAFSVLLGGLMTWLSASVDALGS